MSHAIEAHRSAVQASLQDMASTLVNVLGRPVAAYMVQVRNVKTISRWANGDVTTVRDRYSEERLRAAYQIVSFLLGHDEHPDTIRALMIGMNPILDDNSPAHAIREGDFKGAMDAARNYIAGGY